MMTETCLLQGN